MKTTTETIQSTAQNLGMALMAVAATAGIFELPEHPNSKVVVPNQPAFAFAGELGNLKKEEPIRREKEDTAPHYVSYSVAQRTPGRTGKY